MEIYYIHTHYSYAFYLFIFKHHQRVARYEYCSGRFDKCLCLCMWLIYDKQNSQPVFMAICYYIAESYDMFQINANTRIANAQIFEMLIFRAMNTNDLFPEKRKTVAIKVYESD